MQLFGLIVASFWNYVYYKGMISFKISTRIQFFLAFLFLVPGSEKEIRSGNEVLKKLYFKKHLVD
jgi:hypothetical protein